MLVMGFISNSIYYYNNWINSGFSVKEAKKFLDVRCQISDEASGSRFSRGSRISRISRLSRISREFTSLERKFLKSVKKFGNWVETVIPLQCTS